MKVAGANACGNGPYSPELACTLYHQPIVYSLFTGGGYCDGTAGYDIKLEDSETGVSYELFKDGVTTGIILAGTGELINFGPQTAGEYTVVASNGNCTGNMMGVAQNFVIPAPGQAAQPTGSVNVCNNEASQYTAVLPSDGYWLVWTLGPADAGTLTQPNLTTAQIDWNESFAGVAELLVQGVNECDTGAMSPVLHIQVNAAPQPVISGDDLVCTGEVKDYLVAFATGSTYIWNVSGGIIIAGQGTHEISVEWGAAAGTGTVMVTEETQEGCAANSAIFNVGIEVCSKVDDPLVLRTRVYPNPAEDSFSLMFSQALKENAACEIIDATGRVVASTVIPAGTLQVSAIDISNLPEGIYTIRLRSDQAVVCQEKLIRE